MKFFTAIFLIFPFFCFGQKGHILVHSHNDYLQQKPLFTALEFKINSLEVDVALYQDEIKVCHFPIFLKDKPNFETLYLIPILENKNQLLSVQFLFIDIKSGGIEILEKLNDLFSKHHEIFSSRSEKDVNKIKVIISGSANRTVLVNNASLRYLFADGGSSHLSKNIDSNLMPIVSANYKSMSEGKRIEFINLAHLENKKVRFWNTNDNNRTWEKLIGLNVDFIGVDHIEKFYQFKQSL